MLRKNMVIVLALVAAVVLVSASCGFPPSSSDSPDPNVDVSQAVVATLTAVARSQAPPPTNTPIPLSPTTDVSQAVEATLTALAQSQDLPPTSADATVPPQATIDVADGPFPAGVPLLIDDFSLVVNNEFSMDHMNWIHYSLIIKNVGTRTRLLSFQCSAFSMRDNVGNVYGAVGADREEFYESRQFDLEPGEALKLTAAASWNWAHRAQIPPFAGPIAPQATSLILQLNGVGPFSGLDVTIDL